ncbi:peptidase M48, Ste24p [Sphingopyxis sp. XHP0097]|jgi:hypothetical protein|uniref:Peptidase M48, Ste24p n=1 Tax=Sphingopyxis jiangsuensis TaxID=2871171 RepID=A0ABS7MAJ0_9SPHN|nr:MULTISPECIES: M48 family metallopeptidase [Sphingopyxis]MBL0769888.1 M48 family metalloprotease [Sphingopyxis lutea]MBY4635689.1 peptidase M48, Ste24p [Sphingopyxis jiangsuensis]
MFRRLPALALACAAIAAAPFAARADTATSPYAALAAMEARVAAIGFRLTTANANWCPVRQPQFGWLWGDPRLYAEEDRAAALVPYDASTSDAPFPAAIAPDSPAARTGLRIGTPILKLNGASLPPAEGTDAFARISALETALAALPLDRPLTLATGDGQTVDIQPVTGCASDFRLEARDRPAGAADGRLVLISYGLALFAEDDAELAAAVAHELAHNILRHRERLDAAGVDRGLGKQFGRSARLFRQTEIEADRLSVWLLAGAGYDPTAAARFWTRFGQREGRPLFQAGTHPRWRDRVATLEAEAAAIAAARAEGEPLVPPLVANPPPLE